jgi:hypothetical protein
MVFNVLKVKYVYLKRTQVPGHKTDPASCHRRHPMVTINLRVRNNKKAMVIGPRSGSMPRGLS